SSPAAAASVRSHWGSFWSGSVSRGDSGAVPASFPSATARAAAAAGFLTPAVHRIHEIVAHAPPLLEAAGVLAGAYAANRGFQKLLSRFASKKGLDLHQIAVIRLVSSVVLWTGAASGAMIVGGAPHSTLTAALGAGGTILTLGLRDVLGNVIQGVNFLITRPFPIGARVQIDDQAGTVASASLTTVVIQKDDGSEIRIRHAALASKPVIVFGSYAPKTGFRLAVPVKPKFKGAVVAVFKSVDRRFLLAGAAFAALLAFPSFFPFLAAGWAATAVHAALAVSIAWLTRRVDRMLSAAVDELARANAWRPETKVMMRLLVGGALWTLGGGAALRVLGVTWTALAASLGVTTLGIGLASNNFFGSFVQGAEVLFSKPFKVGDIVKAGAFSGVVEDMTMYHVVLKLDEGRHALVPYAVVRDATLVVTPGK
ncbi:MAG: mechanosensitive ion channel domain-containing protein, partial [Elusimicrobiota bacterium]